MRYPKANAVIASNLVTVRAVNSIRPELILVWSQLAHSTKGHENEVPQKGLSFFSPLHVEKLI